MILIIYLNLFLSSASFAASLSSSPSPSLSSSSLPPPPFYSTSESKEPGCASPEVLVNGSPSPDILETVNGGRSGIGNIQEIQFVGMIGVKGKSERRRICKIKCLNGVWVGPLCTLEAGMYTLLLLLRHLISERNEKEKSKFAEQIQVGKRRE